MTVQKGSNLRRSLSQFRPFLSSQTAVAQADKGHSSLTAGPSVAHFANSWEIFASVIVSCAKI